MANLGASINPAEDGRARVRKALRDQSLQRGGIVSSILPTTTEVVRIGKILADGRFETSGVRELVPSDPYLRSHQNRGKRF